MFKAILFFTLFSVAFARPSLIASSPYVSYSPVAIHQPAYATVGAVVKTVPTSVSHASHSVVHNNAHVVQDVVAPVIKTSYATPVVRAISAPTYGYVHSSPYASYGASPYSYSSW